MTFYETVAFGIFVVMTVGFFAWVAWLARPYTDADPHTPDRKEDV